jgi:hypothetical protein
VLIARCKNKKTPLVARAPHSPVAHAVLCILHDDRSLLSLPYLLDPHIPTLLVAASSESKVLVPNRTSRIAVSNHRTWYS